MSLIIFVVILRKHYCLSTFASDGQLVTAPERPEHSQSLDWKVDPTRYDLINHQSINQSINQSISSIATLRPESRIANDMQLK